MESDDDRKRGPIRRLTRAMLDFTPEPGAASVGESLLLWLLIPLALLICIPILILSFLAGLAVASVLGAVGAPESIQGIPVLLGFGGGLVLCFLLMVRVYRRLPRSVRSLAVPDEEPALPDMPRHDPAADPTTFTARDADLDATIAEREATED